MRWSMLSFRKGDCVEIDLLVKSVGCSDVTLNKPLSLRFNRREGWIHCCLSSPCVEAEDNFLHTTSLRVYSLDSGRLCSPLLHARSSTTGVQVARTARGGRFERGCIRRGGAARRGGAVEKGSFRSSGGWFAQKGKNRGAGFEVWEDNISKESRVAPERAAARREFGTQGSRQRSGRGEVYGERHSSGARRAEERWNWRRLGLVRRTRPGRRPEAGQQRRARTDVDLGATKETRSGQG